MVKVTVLMNNGTTKTMDSRYARALVHCKKAIYLESYNTKVVENNSYLKKSEPKQEVKPSLSPEELMAQLGGMFKQEEPETDAVLTALRKEYSDKFDKKCYHGWSAEEIRAKIQAG